MLPSADDDELLHTDDLWARGIDPTAIMPAIVLYEDGHLTPFWTEEDLDGG